jgi:hypothetical protein
LTNRLRSSQMKNRRNIHMKTIFQFSQLPKNLCSQSELLFTQLDGFITLENNQAEIFVKKGGQYVRRTGVLDKATGYKKLSFYSKSQKKVITVKEHRIISLAFLPNPDNHKIINHKDSDKTNNSLSNLEWTTQSRNVIHNIIHNTPEHNLTKEQVIDIYRRIHEGKEATTNLATEYGVCLGTINHIRSQKTYAYHTETIELASTNFAKRLTEKEIKEIFDLSRNRFWTLSEVADVYNIHYTLVSKIKNGRRYADITQSAS